LQIGDFLQEQVRIGRIDGAALKLAQELYVLQIRRAYFHLCDDLEDPALFLCITLGSAKFGLQFPPAFKRMVKKQQMRWSERGAHLLLQVRTRVLNEDLRNTFCRWYPGMQNLSGDAELKEAA